MSDDTRLTLQHRSTKTYTHANGLSCCFRQWRASSHCRFLHGYAIEVRIEFRCTELDDNGWVMDFGGLKEVKTFLEKHYDHKTIIAWDDPMRESHFQALHEQGIIDLVILKDGVGCERFAQHIFEWVDEWLQMQDWNKSGRVSVYQVEVREHGANSAICRRGNGTIIRGVDWAAGESRSVTHIPGPLDNPCADVFPISSPPSHDDEEHWIDITALGDIYQQQLNVRTNKLRFRPFKKGDDGADWPWQYGDPKNGPYQYPAGYHGA